MSVIPALGRMRQEDRVPEGQPGVPSETLSQKEKRKKLYI
jgi:hypothetical protein